LAAPSARALLLELAHQRRAHREDVSRTPGPQATDCLRGLGLHRPLPQAIEIA
jgi:hypothetical protein